MFGLHVAIMLVASNVYVRVVILDQVFGVEISTSALNVLLMTGHVQTWHSVQIWKVHSGVVAERVTLETEQFVMVRIGKPVNPVDISGTLHYLPSEFN